MRQQIRTKWFTTTLVLAVVFGLLGVGLGSALDLSSGQGEINIPCN